MVKFQIYVRACLFFGRPVAIYLVTFVGRICETVQFYFYIHSVSSSGRVEQPKYCWLIGIDVFLACLPIYVCAGGFYCFCICFYTGNPVFVKKFLYLHE